MPIFTIFNHEGESERLINCIEIDLLHNMQAGEKYILGEYQNHYLVNNQPVEKPPQPSPYHEWDVVKKQWLLPEDAASRMLSDAQEEVRRELSKYQSEVRSKLIGFSDSEERNLKDKYDAAKRILGGDATEADNALIAGEAAARDKYDFMQLVQVIIIKGDRANVLLNAVKGRMNGFVLRINDALEVSTTAAELFSRIRVIRDEADIAVQQLLAMKNDAVLQARTQALQYRIADDGTSVSISPSVAHDWDSKKGDWVLNVSKQAEMLSAELVQAKQSKLSEMNTAAQSFIDQMTGANDTPEYERATWAAQGAEAKAWHADHTAATPTLDNIAKNRGVPAELLRQKAYEKTIAYELLVSTIAGQRQRFEDKLNVSKTLADVNAIMVNFQVKP